MANRFVAVALLGLATLFAIGAMVAFKLPGLVVGIIVVVATAFYISSRQPTDRVQQVRELVALSGADLKDALAHYEEFAYSDDPTHLADRTLHRPELLNQDSSVPEIAEYHIQRLAAERFLRRLEGHLKDPAATQSELENLLAITDQRTAELQQAWWRARTAAGELGEDS